MTIKYLSAAEGYPLSSGRNPDDIALELGRKGLWSTLESRAEPYRVGYQGSARLWAYPDGTGYVQAGSQRRVLGPNGDQFGYLTDPGQTAVYGMYTWAEGQ